MKSLHFVLIALLIITNVGWGIWAFRLRSNPVASVHPLPVSTPAYAPRPLPQQPKVPLANIWQDYQATRIKVLQDHPDLAAEFKGIQDEMIAQRAKLNAAMIEADPKVAPILAKLDAMRPHSLPPGMTPPHPLTVTPSH